MEKKDIRWMQRFSNFRKALVKLNQAVGIIANQTKDAKEVDGLLKDGLIQRFVISMPYGLQESELQKLHELFRANGNIRQVILYGSRAKGNYKPFSDVDITLTGEHLTRTGINRLQAALAESSLPANSTSPCSPRSRATNWLTTSAAGGL